MRPHLFVSGLTFAWALCTGFQLGGQAAAARFEPRAHDHIALVGNALAERMQHFGWLEALFHRQFPEHELVFRNLGYAGDEVDTRLRVEDFGSPDEWLARVQADVVWVFFGFNESFRGEAGLDGFKGELRRYVDHLRSQKYNGRSAPRIVLFSPIAAERHRDPNFPDPTERNRLLALYTRAIQQVAQETGVPFVDLFQATLRLYAEAADALTVNGIHLSEAGYRALAPEAFRELLGITPPRLDEPDFEKLRQAVLEKNALWFSRYRTVDGYNVYGGRSHLSYNGIKNRDVLLREMEMREVMTANRDRRIWAVARGGDLVVKDDNLPPPIEVPTNKRGPNPDGSFNFLGGEEAIAKMTPAKGCRINLFASEEQFPMLANPVQMAFDTRGRLWVAAWPNYPERTPWSQTGDSLLVFEDLDGDGRADKCTPFLEDLNAPTGFQFYKDGVIVVQAPDVWWVRDTDGDGRGDWKERLLSGLSSADTHHTANALALDPGGAIYLSDGVFHRTQVETAWGVVRNNDGAIHRFEPRTGRFEVYIPYGFANPHGRVFDSWGNDLVTDATGNNTYFGPAISGYLDYPEKHPGLREIWPRPARPCAGTGLLTSRHFPEEFQNNFLNCNVIGFQGIYRVQLYEEGAGLWGKMLEPLVVSQDPNFRPVAADVAPDGSVYFLDWHNPIIGHMQHHIRDPNRDHSHGRIYRVTYEGRPLLRPAPIAGQPIEHLLELLKEPENNVRTRAKIELGGRDTAEVLAAVQRWTQRLDPQDPAYEHHLMEALWVHQWHNVVHEGLLRRMLRSPEPRARAAATRVLSDWRTRVADALLLLRRQADDDHPLVRLQAVRAASFFQGPQALDVVFTALAHERDYYLDYVIHETLRQLRFTPADLTRVTHPRALAYLLGRLSDAELLKAPATEGVLLERLQRKSYDVNQRGETLEALAKLHGTDRVQEALAALRRFDALGHDAATPANHLGVLLAATPRDQLTAHRRQFNDLAHTAKQPVVRQAVFAAWVVAEADPQPAWQATTDDPAARTALIDSIVLHADPNFRARFQPLLDSVLDASSAPREVQRAALLALRLMGEGHAARNFITLAKHLQTGPHRDAAAYALRQLPRSAWQPELAGPTTDALLAWARTVPADHRTQQAYIETVQAARDLATLLPPDRALRLTKELGELSVSVFVIKSVREQMRYDTPRLVVVAGKPFEIIFENVDMMPHNLVIVQPGAREEVGLQAEKMPPRPDDQGRMYVPANQKILAATKLLDPGNRETLKLTAPETPGAYEYVCTYPEHWKVMYGQLLVVPDADALARAMIQPPPQAIPAAAHHHASGYE